MQQNYKAFIDRMINRYEGGYGWDKNDTGGPTKYGITCYDLAENRGQKMDSMSSWAPYVEAMSLSEAEDIYRKKYAAAIRFDDLPSGIDCVMMDYAVNSGIGRAIPQAASMLHVTSSSTRLSDALLSAINSSDRDKLINDMCDERLAYMHRIRGGSAWAQFGHGWSTRVADLRAYALHLSDTTKPIPLPPDLSNVPTPKAHDPVPPPPDVEPIAENPIILLLRTIFGLFRKV